MGLTFLHYQEKQGIALIALSALSVQIQYFLVLVVGLLLQQFQELTQKMNTPTQKEIGVFMYGLMTAQLQQPKDW